MPVTQYRRGSTGYRFLECHFETLWNEAEDRTDELVRTALERDKAYRGRSEKDTLRKRHRFHRSSPLGKRFLYDP